ncbi:hypothetical protein AMECASPLE_003074 [Ameca splendens]|uniref:Uncharacterized protein n=1 Tax=Ameca splendens TaxID=208324 RepID=A0ABV0YKI6_9TELE
MTKTEQRKKRWRKPNWTEEQNLLVEERSVGSTSLECEQLWYLLQSEAREEIAAHQRTSPQTGSVVDDHLGLGSSHHHV